MGLLKQCKKWHENNEYQKIIEAIETIPAEERTPELDSQLAYAYYFSDQKSRALNYFEQVLEACPENKDIRRLMDECRNHLSLPIFEKNFRKRTAEAWELFEQGEEELRCLMDQGDQDVVGEKLVEKCTAFLQPAFKHIAFEMGFNGKKYELILTPEGDRAKLFELVYFQQHAPSSILDHWNIFVGRQHSSGFGLRAGDHEISGKDVQMAYIDTFDVIETPKEEPSILLEELPQIMENMELSLSLDPQQYLDTSYIGYQLTPEEEPKADWREDIYIGSTRLAVLINEYLNGDSDVTDTFYEDGAAAGFFCYPLDRFTGEDQSEKILGFRDDLEAEILKNAGEDAATFLGGATGLYCGYLDFIAWDLQAVLNAATKFFEGSSLTWANFHSFRRDAKSVRLLDGGDDEPMKHQETIESAEDETLTAEYYTIEEMNAVEQHIEQYFGQYESVWHELASPDIHVDICLITPTADRDYFTLVTMGMGAHRMNAPGELTAQQPDRAELVITLPLDWKLDTDAIRKEQWYWPIRLLKSLARLPKKNDTWLGLGHTMDYKKSFADNTDLCATMLIAPRKIEKNGAHCILPNGDRVNFYQVIPLYRDELEYKLWNNAEALMTKLEHMNFVIDVNRPDALNSEEMDEEEYIELIIDDGNWHLESIYEKKLPVEDINAYNHMAIYLRWCIEHNLMSKSFLEKHSEQVNQVKMDPAHTDLRVFIQNELEGLLLHTLFNNQGKAFSQYYYGENDAPRLTGDIEDYALQYFGAKRYYSNKFKQEAYLFLPFNEDYYQSMAKVIQNRWECWKNQEVSDDAALSELAQAMIKYLNCACRYFPPMASDDPIIASLGYARRLGVREGFVPMLITVDEILWECLILNSDPESENAGEYAFDPARVASYRKTMLSMPVKDGKAVLSDLSGMYNGEAEVLGKMENGEANDRFLSYWDFRTDKTAPLILARIPVKEPWQIFVWLPFGGWNECPGTADLIAIAKYWNKEYNAVPAAMTHDELEFVLPVPAARHRAMKLAAEQYRFCPDVVEQGVTTVGKLADSLQQSCMWYFWWD